MENNFSTYFIIGGFFAKQLNDQLERKINKKGAIFQFPMDYESPDGYLCDICDKLSSNLREGPIDYLILELRSLLDLIDPDCYDQQIVFAQIDRLINLLANYSISSSVLIIESFIPQYFIIDDILIKEIEKQIDNSSSLKQLSRIEHYIQKKTGGVLINTASFYFYYKKRGYKLNNRWYEKECYLDICSKIVHYVKNGKGIKNGPDPRQSINRYIKYGNRTILFDALQVFLKSDNPFSSFVLSSPNNFVKTYKKEFLRLNKIKFKDYFSWKKTVESSFMDSPSFCNIAVAFYSLFFDHYDDSISYSELFKQRIVSLNTRKIIQKYVADHNIASSKQINNHNAGFYFALMHGYSDDEAMSFVHDNSVIKPELIDVFGSCISRTCLREYYSGNTTLAANNYWFQIPAYSEIQPEISLEPSVFDGFSGVSNNNTIIQLKHRVSETIMQSDASWIIADLYGLITPHTYEYRGFYYTDMYGDISRRLGAEKIRTFDNPLIFGNEELLKKGLDLWCDSLKKKYNDQIILLAVNLSALSKGDDNVIYCPRKRKKVNRMNQLLKKAYEYVKEKLNCYCIEFTYEFCPDDRGYKTRLSSHYSYDFYKQAYKRINYIVQNKPAKKCFDSYSYVIKVRRLADLIENNDKSVVTLFLNSRLDRLVMKLPASVIRENIALIILWYQKKYNTVDDILEGWLPEWDNRIKTYLLEPDNIPVNKEPIIQEDYASEPFDWENESKTGLNVQF